MLLGGAVKKETAKKQLRVYSADSRSRAERVLIPSYHSYESAMIVTGAKGWYIEDDTGRKIVDLNSGYWTVPLGHRSIPIRKLFDKGYYCHLFGDLHPSAVILAERLCALTGYSRVGYSCTGTGAIDAALRIAFQCSGRLGNARSHIVCVERGFHGTSFSTLLANGLKYDRWLPKCFNVTRLGAWVADATLSKADAEAHLEDARIPWEQVAAFIYEPVQGVGGIRPLSQTAIEVISKKCRQACGLVIADEITTGLGRTGSLLATESWEPRPDVVCIGKSLTNGEFPLAAVLTSGDVWLRVAASQSHDFGKYLFGDTYAGHPAGCMIAMRVIDRVVSDSFLKRVRDTGHWLETRLRERLRDVPITKRISGVGLMWGVELTDRDKAVRVAAIAYNEGVRVGREGRVLTILPPLSMPRRVLNSAIDIVANACIGTP